MEEKRLIRYKQVTTRKKRPCSGCGKEIKVGSKAWTGAVMTKVNRKKTNTLVNVMVCPVCHIYTERYGEIEKLEEHTIYMGDRYLWDKIYSTELTEEEMNYYENT